MRTHLTVCRPSPTTVLYNVSNVLPRKTFTANLFLYLTIVARSTLALSTLILLIIRYQQERTGAAPETGLASLGVWLCSIAPILERVATGTTWPILAPTSLLVLFLCFRRFHTGTTTAEHLVNGWSLTD